MSRGKAGESPRPGVTLLAEAFTETLAGLQARSVRALREEVWAPRLRPFWRITPSAYRRLSRVLQGRGENFLAIEVAEEGLAWFPHDLELIHLLGLAYARTGASDTADGYARRLLETLGQTADGWQNSDQTIHWQVEALTLQARIEKDRAVAIGREERSRHLRRCLECYEEAYRHGTQGLAEDEKYYPTINAAAVAAALGDPERAERYATLARESCRRTLRQGGGDPYWPAATLAECALLLGESDEAVADAYRRATALAPNDRAKQNATRRQARTLLRAQGRPPEQLDGCFSLPRIVLFAGHLTDLPGRTVPRFPEQAVGLVSERITALLEECAPQRSVPLIGFASAARGGDLLFLEAMRARGDEFHVVLPSDAASFRLYSVEAADAPNGWGARFDRILEAATSVWTLPAGSGELTADLFAYGNQILHGLALQKAREFELDDAHLLTLAVWDGRPGDGVGGTASCVRNWRVRGHVPVILSPVSGEKIAAAETNSEHGPVAAEMDTTRTLLCGEWLADPCGAANEDEFFASAAARLREPPFAAALAGRPTVEDTRFCIVFRSADVAAQFAWTLQAWAESRGLKNGLRLGLHAGPLTMRSHPLNGQTGPSGPHRAQAATICRASAEGQIGASREFVALLATENSRLCCEYLGLRACPPDGELHALYTLRLPHGEDLPPPERTDEPAR